MVTKKIKSNEIQVSLLLVTRQTIKMTHIFLSQLSSEQLIRNDSGFKQCCSNIQSMGDDRKKETKIEKKDEFGNTVEEKKIEEKEKD